MKFIVALGVLAALYAAACTFQPYGTCWRCGGAGRHRGLILRGRVVECRWCRSSGHRLRLGRRAYNRGARARREGQARRTDRAGAR